LSEAAHAEFGAQAEAEILGGVYPVYGRLIDYYESILPQTAGNHGVGALPDGEEYYAFAISLMTTTGMTADEIHRIGLAEVARIGAEIDAGIDPYFNVRPDVGVKVERVPEFREGGSALAYYQPPSLDGARPGVFYISLREISELPRFGMRTLAYHEAIPGHHFQIAIAQQLKGLPLFRRMLPLPAYAEGWALYTEQLAWEIGFQDDPLDNLGRLQAEMFRAVRLVVDTGLRARSQEALGDAFSLAEFHDVVLTNGALPLDKLERVIDDWLAEKSRARS